MYTVKAYKDRQSDDDKIIDRFETVEEARAFLQAQPIGRYIEYSQKAVREYEKSDQYLRTIQSGVESEGRAFTPWNWSNEPNERRQRKESTDDDGGQS